MGLMPFLLDAQPAIGIVGLVLTDLRNETLAIGPNIFKKPLTPEYVEKSEKYFFLLEGKSPFIIILRTKENVYLHLKNNNK
jgi:hypothetical protein